MYFLTLAFPHVLLLFQNDIAIFQQTWHNAILRSNKEPRLSSKNIFREIIKMHILRLKILFSTTNGGNYNQTWDKALLYFFLERKKQGPLQEDRIITCYISSCCRHCLLMKVLV
jgi:hypothetical protein